MARNVYSRQMESALRKFFEVKLYSTPSYVGGYKVRDIRFNNHNFNPVFLRISSNQNREVHEIPSLICERMVRIGITTWSIGESVTPLSVIDSQTRRTADSIFKYFFSSGRPILNHLGLKKAITSKGEVYYGASGLTLNSNFEPIMIGLSEYRKDGGIIHFKRHVLKVSPEVFISEGLLEKAIVKKLIPFYSRYDMEGRTVRVEIDDISKYVVKPVPPKANVQETMKEIMCTYKEEILKDLLP